MLNDVPPGTADLVESKSSAQNPTSSTFVSEGYTHRPPIALLAWLVVSLPLVTWGTLYVHLRPYTMPGGTLHSPLWEPYAMYGSVDYIYGWPAWNSRNGFTAAQSAMNVLESIFYCWYLYVTGHQIGDWSYAHISHLEVRGNGVSLAVLLSFSAAVMTVSKTLLYFKPPLLPRVTNGSPNCFQGLAKLSPTSQTSDTIPYST